MRGTENELNVKWSESFFIKSIMTGLTFLTAVVNLILAITKFAEGNNIYAIVAIVLSVVFAVLMVVFFSLRTVQKNTGIKSKRDYDKFVAKISNITHDLLHRMRNSIYYIEDAYSNNRFYSVKDFEEYVTLEILQLVEFLASELTKVLDTPVRVCIKCLNYTENNENDINKMKLVTFARSGFRNIHDIMQEHLYPINIDKNTDFLEIVQNSKNSRQRQYFYEKNLKEFDERLHREGKKYENSNDLWSSDYITTIVCPIRLKRQTEKSVNSTVLEYDLIGFLCVDSLDDNAFCNEYSDFCFDLLKGLADILYVYLDRFIDYYNEIKGELEDYA